MIKKIFLLSIFSLFIISCSSSKVVTKRPTGGKNYGKNYALRNLNSNFSGSNTRKVDKLLHTAEDYMGTPYKFGGVTRSGMDCSGFITTVYDSQDINLPRRSEDQSREGREISIKNVIPGDLLFFATSGGSRVSHVGIVHTIRDGEVNFIHASTSKGVMISSLNEKYWNKAYLSARRVL